MADNIILLEKNVDIILRPTCASRIDSRPLVYPCHSQTLESKLIFEELTFRGKYHDLLHSSKSVMRKVQNRNESRLEGTLVFTVGDKGRLSGKSEDDLRKFF